MTATEPLATSPPAAAPSPHFLTEPADRRSRWGLGTRIFLAAALFEIALLGFAIGLANGEASRQAEREIRANLAPVPEIFASYSAAEASSRRNQLRTLAEESGTKALLGGGADTATFHDQALDYARGLGAATVFLFDGSGVLLARSDREAGEEAGRDFSKVAWVASPLSGASGASAYILEVTRTHRLSLVASAQVAQGGGDERRVVGVVAAAFPIDTTAARTLSRLVSGRVFVLGNLASRNQPIEIGTLASSLDVGDSTLLGRLSATPALVDTLLKNGKPFGPFEFTLGDETFLGTALPIHSGSGEPIAALLVARSKEEELAVFRRIRRGILLGGLAMLVLSLPLSYVLARRASRPIEQLARGADAVRRGDLDIEFPSGGAAEVGQLANAFRAMVGELRAKQELEHLLASMSETSRPSTPANESSAPLSDLPEAAGEPIAGRLFARRFEVVEALGEGGMGTVFKVRDSELDEMVALKVLTGKNSRDRTTGDQLLRQEIKLARSITHPNVVRMHDLGEANGTRFITMEYVNGTTLRKVLDRGRRLDLLPGLQIAKQACRGLQAVHAAGIIHGDLKPENVMVMPSGGVKLMDFGVARLAASQRTAQQMVVGTPRYMSPEQARGAVLDESSDIYSLGVLMFETFAGRPPFESEDSGDLMRLHIYADPPGILALRPELPESLANLVAQCLSKSRTARPLSAADLDRALMRIH
jgi:tRNA A-37 threonylcarbamoyl transferase component Bud32/HAMP domain-containing protein